MHKKERRTAPVLNVAFDTDLEAGTMRPSGLTSPEDSGTIGPHVAHRAPRSADTRRSFAPDIERDPSPTCTLRV